MIIVFEKKTNKLVGVASKVFDSGSWREPELGELYPDANLNKDFSLNFRTTGGTLSARRVEAKRGAATVELTSTVETIAVTVSASAEGTQSGSLTFELMPPEA